MSHLVKLVAQYTENALEDDRFLDADEFQDVLVETCNHFGVPPVNTTACVDLTTHQLTVLVGVLGGSQADLLKFSDARMKDKLEALRQTNPGGNPTPITSARARPAEDTASAISLERVSTRLHKHYGLEEADPILAWKLEIERPKNAAPKTHVERAGKTRAPKPASPKTTTIRSPLPIYDEVPEGGFRDIPSMLAFVEQAKVGHKGGLLFTLLTASNVIEPIKLEDMAAELTQKLHRKNPKANGINGKIIRNMRNANGGKGCNIIEPEAEAIMDFVAERSEAEISGDDRARCVKILTIPSTKATREALRREAEAESSGQSAVTAAAR